MPHDPELVAETRGWLAKAALDPRAAAHSLTAVPPLVDDIVFHAQQAAEKCFKAFASLKATVDRAVPLTEYAWKFRYPGEVATPTDDEAQAALSDARAVFRCCSGAAAA